MRGPDVGTALVRALVAAATRCGCAVEIVTAEWQAWESATFSGARHEIVLASDDAAFGDWLGGLAEAEFALRGHLVADIAVDSLTREGGRHVATIAALTLIET